MRKTRLMTAMVAVAVMCLGLTVVAQNPIPNPPQVGQRTWTIQDTGHDFGDGAGLGADAWVGDGDNMCAPCHGVPASGYGSSSAPVWNHDESAFDHDGTDWLYSRNDRVVVGDAITEFADGGGPSYHRTVLVTSANNLMAGEKVLISGPSYAGEHEVGEATAADFTIAGVFGSTDVTGASWDPVAETTGPAFDQLSTRCLGCHDGTVYLQAYAGQAGSITAFANNPPGATDVTSAGHGLADDDVIEITGTTNYDDAALVVSVVDADTFTIVMAFSGNDATGTWKLSSAAALVYMTGDENLTTALASTHHPVGIGYTKAFADSVGYLKDPTRSNSNPQGGSITDTLLTADRINCNSCHEQHNDRRFDLFGDSNKDDPELGDTSEEHNFLILHQAGCRVCHESGRGAAAFSEAAEEDAARTHHFPGRDDPWGDARNPGGDGLIFSCAKCHDLGDPTTAGNQTHPCAECHVDFPERAEFFDGEATIATGHHGASRHSPYTNCVACHADPVTGLLTGNEFGNTDAPSCFECHGDLWFGGDTDGPTVTAINGVADGADLTLYADELSTLVCDATDPDSAEQILVYTWSFGDGTVAQFPSFDNTTTHTYEFYNYYKYGDDYPIMTLSVAVTDGVNPPETISVNLIVKPAARDSGPDEWTVTVDPLGPDQEIFDISIEDYDGSLVVVQESGANKGQLAYGVQFDNVIFWMDLWMDLDGSAYWGTGDMYFANNDGRKMDGVVFRTDGTVLTFTAD